MTRQRLLLASLLAAWVGMVLACGGSGGGGGSPSTGEAGILYNPDRGNDVEVVLAVDEKALDELIQIALPRDENEMVNLLRERRIIFTPSHTRVLVLDPGVSKTKVRMMDGPHTGRSCFVLAEWVHSVHDGPRTEPAPSKVQTEEERKAEVEQRAKANAAEEKRRAETEAESRARKEAREKAREEAREEAAQKKAEERAASYLKYAKKLWVSGMEEKAKERLEEVVREFPKTKAAAEARELLGK